jgi:hypothetical protein
LKYVVRVVVALAILVPPAAAQAQVEVGFRVGVNISSISSKYDPPLTIAGEHTASATGFVGGGFVTVPVNGVFAFQPEVLFSRQGSTSPSPNSTLRTRLDYLQVPLLARVRLGWQSPLAIVVGPSFGFKTNATRTVDGTFVDLSTACCTFDSRIKGYDVGLVTGGVFTAGRLVFDGRYTWGLTNTASAMLLEHAREVGITITETNRVLSLSAGLRF